MNLPSISVCKVHTYYVYQKDNAINILGLLGQRSTILAKSPSMFSGSTTIFIESSSMSSESTTIFIESQTMFSESVTLFTENPSMFPESATIFTESQTIFSESVTMFTENPSMFSESATIFTEIPSMSSESTTIVAESQNDIPNPKTTFIKTLKPTYDPCYNSFSFRGSKTNTSPTSSYMIRSHHCRRFLTNRYLYYDIIYCQNRKKSLQF